MLQTETYMDAILYYVHAFAGNEDHSPMIWGVEYDGDRWNVVETYDHGRTWIRNCTLDSYEECEQFILAWFEQWD